MSNRDNRTYKIYHKPSRQWFAVSREEYLAYRQNCDRIRMREQYHGRCECPNSKRQFCDGICDGCEFHRLEEYESLDSPVSDSDGDTLLLQDIIPDTRASVEHIVITRDLLARIFRYFREQDPDADIILSMWMADPDISARKIAEALGRLPRTFAYQLKRYRAELRKVLEI